MVLDFLAQRLVMDVIRDFFLQQFLVSLGLQQVVRFFLCYDPCGFLLAMHRIGNHHASPQFHCLQQFLDGGNLVALVVHGLLRHRHSHLRNLGADDMQRALLAPLLFRGANRLPVDRNREVASFALAHGFDPLGKASAQGFRIDQGQEIEHPVIARNLLDTDFLLQKASDVLLGCPLLDLADVLQPAH